MLQMYFVRKIKRKDDENLMIGWDRKNNRLKIPDWKAGEWAEGPFVVSDRYTLRRLTSAGRWPLEDYFSVGLLTLQKCVQTAQVNLIAVIRLHGIIAVELLGCRL